MSERILATVLDLDPNPAFVVDALTRIIHRNAAAGRLQQGDGIWLDDESYLRVLDDKLTVQVTARVASLIRSRNFECDDRAPLRVPSARPLVLTFQPLITDDGRFVLIKVQDAANLVEDHCAVFARTFGLSPPEMLLLRALVNGFTLTEYCQRDGLNIWTERDRLHRLYRLSGARRQSSLIIAVLTGVTGVAAQGTARPSGWRPKPASAMGGRETADSRKRPAGAETRPSTNRWPPSAGMARPPLPSFTGLKAFEAFVRLGSMTAAALELRTFPSNISRHISRLEDATGLTLTEGSRTLVRPSQAGLTLASAADEAFNLVHAAAPLVALTPRKASSFVRDREARRDRITGADLHNCASGENLPPSDGLDGGRQVSGSQQEFAQGLKQRPDF